jgi:hypothetical protein
MEPQQKAGDGVVPASALPVWPPPTSPVATGYQPRTGAAVLPAPPPPVLAPPVEPPANGVTNGTAAPEPRWPANPPATSSQYGEWARQQRPAGTVYGATAPGQDRPAFAPGGTQSMEVSGSLTGHILAHGRPVEAPVEKSGGSRGVIIAMVVVCVVILAVAGAVVAHLAGLF